VPIFLGQLCLLTNMCSLAIWQEYHFLGDIVILGSWCWGLILERVRALVCTAEFGSELAWLTLTLFHIKMSFQTLILGSRCMAVAAVSSSGWDTEHCSVCISEWAPFVTFSVWNLSLQALLQDIKHFAWNMKHDCCWESYIVWTSQTMHHCSNFLSNDIWVAYC
jgi:hypothetical protein